MTIVGSIPPIPPRKRRVRRLRTVAMLPTLLTLGNMLCGFAAIYFCLLGIFDAATAIDPTVKSTLNNRFMEQFLPTFVSVGGFLIFVGMFFDAMDGRIARMTSGTTNFGGQLDSLADMVSFGIAPVLLMIALVTMHTKLSEETFISTKEAWVAGAIFASCCALRLARFNVEHAEGDLSHTSFDGLPSPGGASLMASLIILHEYLTEFSEAAYFKSILLKSMPGFAVLAGLLMVSRIRYVHVANTFLRGRRPFGYVLALLVFLAFFIRFPTPTLAVMAIIYTLSGPVGHFWPKRKPLAEQVPAADAKQDVDSARQHRSTRG